MPKLFFKRYMPSRETLAGYRVFRPFAALLTDPGLWALSRRSTAKAFGIGVFAAWLPIPLQTLVVLGLVIWFRVNLPVAILASFVSNPVTMGPMMFSAYWLGALILQRPPRADEVDVGITLLFSELERIGTPLFLGAIILGLLTGIAAALVINIAWRASARRLYRTRRARRRKMGIRFRRLKRRKTARTEKPGTTDDPGKRES